MEIFPQSFFNAGLRGGAISPEYRELELLTQIKLTPECRVRVVGEEILGIYESFRGVKEAILRNDPEMALFFLDRLNPVARERLIYELESGKVETKSYRTLALRTVLQELSLRNRVPLLEIETEDIARGVKPFVKENFTYRNTLDGLYYLVIVGREEALLQALAVLKRTTKRNRPHDIQSLFLCALESGRIDFVNRMVESLPKYLPYPRVEEVTREVDFVNSDYRRLEDYILRQESYNIELRFYEYALKGGNPRLLVYLAALSAHKPLAYPSGDLLSGYEEKRDLLPRYICAQFFPSHWHAPPVTTSSIDLYRILSLKSPETERKKYAMKFLFSNLGNIDILFYILDAYPEERDNIKQIVQDRYQGLYPLTERIL